MIADKELLKIRHKANSDSWGICIGVDYYGEKKFIKFSSSKYPIDWMWSAYDLWDGDNNEVLIHFRTATSGTEKDKGIQPIIFNDIAIFHNGNFPEYFGNKETDTVLWTKDNPDPLNHLEEIEKYCEGNNSKMAFMDENGRVYLINKKEWVEEKGMWFSNERVGNYGGFGYSGILKDPNKERYL